MKKITIFLVFNSICQVLLAQPSFFSWQRPQEGTNKGNNYISLAKDQREQSPCHIFAAVAAVEAMSHIYYNKPFPINYTGCLDLSEREIYSWCSGFGGLLGSASIPEALNYIDIHGIIDESCFVYPQSGPYYTDCSTKCSNPQIEVNTPGFEQILLETDQELKKAIIDYGPIAALLLNSGLELHGAVEDNSHSVLIIGWNAAGDWHLKDSWPGQPAITFKDIDVFKPEFHSKFYRVKYENEGSVISCSGSGCSNVFSSRSCVDNDGDGFYNWGIGAKPSGFIGPCKMDFNDSDPTKIFLDNDYIELPTPTITRTDNGSDYVCQTGSTFKLNNLPEGFSVSWQVSPSGYFNSPTSGTSITANIYPSTQYSGVECSIIYTISDGCGSATYSKKFTINGPLWSKVSINVVESYANPPVLFSEVWLLCPNSSYYIYLNNNSGCSTNNYQWNIPTGWTKYEQTDNYIRINTNNTPSGVINITATTCCNANYLIKTQYFGRGNYCGGYFMAYPNPASSEINIKFKKEIDLKEKDISMEIYDFNYNRRFITKDIQEGMKIKTDGLSSNYYYLVLKYKGIIYTEKIRIEK